MASPAADPAVTTAAAAASPSPPTSVLGRFASVGFDLDHTLIRYKLEPFTSFLYELIRDHVVAHSHYPTRIKSVPLDQNVMHKALVWDAHTGNTLKLSSTKRVLAASHGCLLDSDSPMQPRMLSAEAIAAAYPAPLSDFDGARHPRWFPFYTYFEMPSLPLVQMMVECTDRGLLTDPRSLVGRDVAAGQPYGHIFPALSAAFEFHLASGNQGSYFSAFRADPSRFVERRPEIAQWLRDLRESGHFVFLATNSKFDYCDLLCTYSFGPDWQSLFDITIVDAKKPSWFMEEGAVPRAEIQHASTMKNPFARAAVPSAAAADSSAAPRNNNAKSTHVPRPFYFVDPQTQLADFSRIATEQELAVPHALFVHGNAAGITKLVKQFVTRKQQQQQHSSTIVSPAATSSDSAAEPSIIYFGDHLHSDCMATRQFTNWAAGAIVEEIETMHCAPNGTATAAASKENDSTTASAVCRRRHETFHSLAEILAADAACAGAESSFGSFFHHHHAPATASSASAGAAAAGAAKAADRSCCSAADCVVSVAASAPEWTYWHHVLDLHCEVVVGCLTDFVRGDGEATKEAPSSPSNNAAAAASSSSSAAISPAAPASLPTLNVRLNASCIHAPTFVRFHPPAFGSHYSSETPASIEAYRAAAQAAEAARRAAAAEGALSRSSNGSNGTVQVPAPQEALLQYSIHRVPVSMKMELRPIFPELSTLPAVTDVDAAAVSASSSSGASSSSSSGVLSASAFKSLPILAVPTFQPSLGGLAMVSLTPEVEREKNRMLEVFHAFAMGVCNRIRAMKHSGDAGSTASSFGSPVWAEVVDPCSGYPVIGPHGSSIYSEVEGSAVLLGYRMEQVGSCACIDHPLWHLAHYPATLLTTASLEQTLQAIEQTVAELQPTNN